MILYVAHRIQMCIAYMYKSSIFSVYQKNASFFVKQFLCIKGTHTLSILIYGCRLYLYEMFVQIENKSHKRQKCKH